MNCSAYIKAIKNVCSDCTTVVDSSTHYNHKNQLGHSHINNTTKFVVAEKLEAGISPNFNTDRIQRHSNVFVSVSTMVHEMQASDYNAVLLFKQQSENSSKKYTSLDTHDFLLVLQTEFQKEMFAKFGKNGICVDATYNVNSYSFHLISVLVLDQYQEGIPVAWGILNREDEAVIKYIFEAIKSTCGDLSTEWFMSDMALQYYNA